MVALARSIEFVRSLVPDLEERIGRFEVEAFDPDDDILAAFREELERLSGDLKTGLVPFDRDQIKLAAHSMKGMCGAMGLPELSVLSQEIELSLCSDEQDRTVELSNALIQWAHDFIGS